MGQPCQKQGQSFSGSVLFVTPREELWQASPTPTPGVFLTLWNGCSLVDAVTTALQMTPHTARPQKDMSMRI